MDEEDNIQLVQVQAQGIRWRLAKLFGVPWEMMIRWYYKAVAAASLSTTAKIDVVSASTVSFILVFLLFLFVVAFHWIDMSLYTGISFQGTASISIKISVNYPKKDEHELTCPTTNMTLNCPANYPAMNNDSSSPRSCPDYFRWILEDLKPWKKKGITKEMVEELEKYAHFRLIVINGTAYVKQYDKAFQTRDVFTLWGVLQLLRLYPGRLPDIDLMFQCHDRPSIKKHKYQGKKEAEAPPLFHYCGSDSTFDIVFPDWSFWGWPEVNIKPWVPLMKDIEEENMRANWTNKEPYAFWKGNLYTGARQELGKCNSINDWNAAIHGQDKQMCCLYMFVTFWGWPEVNIKPWVPLMKDIEEENMRANWTNKEPYAFWKGNLYTGARQELGKCNSINDWNAAIHGQDWRSEIANGFKNSDLLKQCNYRYKIYMEGNAWSVSEKYTLACDSMTLLVNPEFYDFFSRSLVPMMHYWPINEKHVCPSIKYAVEWGNRHQDKAQEISKAGSTYIKEEITMDNVYDYMFHVLDQYGRLLRYKPTVPPEAVELCSETWGCSPIGLETSNKIQTMVKGRAQGDPCTMPPPYGKRKLQDLLEKKAKNKKEVKKWERKGKQ
ncbi:O-glucosyltransferase rumi-like protein [Drosera capensis]